MKKYDTVRQIFQVGGGIATTRQMLDARIHTSYISELVNTGVISRLKRGVYEWAVSDRRTDAEIISSLIPDAIICMDTMLYYYGYTDRTPDAWHIAVDKRLNRKRLKIAYPPLKVHFVAGSCLRIGLDEMVIDGRTMRVYDRERTIVDVIRHALKIEPEVVAKAIQAYAKDGCRHIDRLIEYSRRFRVHRKVADLVGVWV